jgi:hypothetical protein
MADHGLFIGWGAPVYGREEKGLGVFAESIEFYGKLQGEGRIESFEAALLDPHGGDLEGFVLVRGTRQQMADLRGDADFRRLVTRASLIIQSLGMVDAVLGEELGREIGVYQEAAQEMA